MSIVFAPARLGSLALQNHIAMSPMTRCRAIGNLPNDLVATYYGQRASAGLIISEGVAPSPNGVGYARIPGVFSAAQVDAWKKVVAAAHAGGARFFMQLMHTGRVAHPLNLPAGARIVAPSAVAAAGQMWTDSLGMQDQPVPQVLTVDELQATVAEFAGAARNAVAAGCDGIELHGANGYLLEQFIRPNSNRRADAYGGAIAQRARFVLEVVDAVCAAIGADKVGIRLSPYGVFNDMPLYDGMAADYTWLAGALATRGIAYVHLVDHASMGAPVVPEAIKATYRKAFPGKLILSGGYDLARATADLEAGKADVIAVGRPFIANPDLLARWQAGKPLAEANAEQFYTADAAGYTDYPKA